MGNYVIVEHATIDEWESCDWGRCAECECIAVLNTNGLSSCCGAGVLKGA